VWERKAKGKKRKKKGKKKPQTSMPYPAPEKQRNLNFTSPAMTAIKSPAYRITGDNGSAKKTLLAESKLYQSGKYQR